MNKSTLLALCLAGFSLPAWANPSLPSSDTSIFSDEFLLQLKKGTTQAQVDTLTTPALKQSATDLLAGTFRSAERKTICSAYEPVNDLAKRLKTSPYSQFENPTGIYYQAGEQAIVIVKGLGKQSASLRICDFGPNHADESYPLTEGVNVFQTKKSGLAYVSYYTPDYKTAGKITVSQPTGKVNGVFRINSNQDWQKLLSQTTTDVIDLVGNRVQLIYSVKELREVCKDANKLLSIYDQIITHQHQLMGLDQYKIVPKNHILGRVIWRGYMHADGTGAAFHHDTLKNLANPDVVHQHSWGIAHEFGHVNQTRPGMKWVSTTEVSNNIFSAWSNYQLNPTDMRLEHERINGGDGNVIGGRFNSFLNSALVAHESWLCQRGPDKMAGYENGGDHFVKLAPLWQLQLFFAAAGHGNPNFYADIFQKVRNTDETKLTNGQLQLNFMKNAGDALKCDLSDFFTSVGMLKPIDKELDDYQRAQLTITEADCEATKAYLSKYKKPDSPVIYYISTNSVNAYKKRLKVEGTFDQGLTQKNKAYQIDHKIWKNAVAFETYKGDELIKIAIAGTDSKTNESSLVAFPDGATRIEAVSWDGKRTLVHGQR